MKESYSVERKQNDCDRACVCVYKMKGERMRQRTLRIETRCI